jgi:putative NIF3 family GTP cyclohydrolase 1 type 2
VFPTTEVLERFITDSEEGDMLFLHHPIDIECGDPRGRTGRGFLPIDLELLKRVLQKKLSLYSCHSPLDTHRKIGTGVAIVEALGAKVQDSFYPYGNGYAGIIATIRQTTTEQLIEKLKRIFEIPYVDFAGKSRVDITRIGIVPGAGYNVTYLQETESKGVQAYITGEIFDRIEGDYGRKAFAQVEKFAQETRVSLIAVSHSASEYLVMKNQMVVWLENNFNVTARLLPLSRWWR